MFEQIVPFLTKHWWLALALVIIILALLVIEFGRKGKSGRVSPSEATHLINRERAVVIDIRDREEYSHGHIVNAIHIPQNELLNNPNKIKKYQDKTIILVCRQGHFSPAVVKKLQKSGFDKVFMLAGGISSWKEFGLPLTK